MRDPKFGYWIRPNEKKAYLKKYGNRKLGDIIESGEELAGNEFLWDAIPDLKQSNLYLLKYQGNQPMEILREYPEMYYGGISLVSLKLDLNPIAKTLTVAPRLSLICPPIKFTDQSGNVLLGRSERTKRELVCTLYGSLGDNGIYVPNEVKIKINGQWDESIVPVGEQTVWGKFY